MMRRISLRPAGSAAALIAFVAVVLSLFCASSLALRNGSPLQPGASPARSKSGPSTLLDRVRHAAHKRPSSTASAASHRAAGQTAERRLTAAALGQSAEIHYPGGPPDVPVAVLPPGQQFPVDLVDLPVDAFAEVIATTVGVSHRGRAPPATGYGI